MPLIHCRKPAIKPSILGLEASAQSSVPAPALIAPSNNKPFKKFMRTCIKKVCDQALVGKVRDKFDQLF